MKLKSVIIALFSLAVLASCQPGSTRSEKMTTAADSASYAIGVLIGEQNKRQLEASGSEDMNTDLLITSFEKMLNLSQWCVRCSVSFHYCYKHTDL